jgi:hypothetical protein
MASRIVEELVSSVTILSIPIPNPPSGGHPCRGHEGIHNQFPSEEHSSCFAHIAQTVELQLLIDSNLLLTFFKFAPSTETLFSLIDHCVKNDRNDFLQYLFLVGLEPLLKVGKMFVRELFTRSCFLNCEHMSRRGQSREITS